MLETPTLGALIDRISSDWNNRFANNPLYDARIPKTIPWVIVRVWAGVAFLLYGFGVQIANQVLPSTCNESFLAIHAGIWSIPRKIPTAAVGLVTFSGTPAALVPAGTQVKRGDGVTYATDANVNIGGGGTASTSCTAIVAASAGNCASGTLLALVSPVGGVSSSCTAGTGGFAGGTDLELVADWRARIIDRIRLLAQGGSAADYTIWTESTPGVLVARVWPLAHTPNAGDVSVYFLVDGSGAARIPGGGDVSAVQAQLDGLRPINDHVFARAPTDQPVAFTISALSPDTSDMRAAVSASLTSMFDRYASLAGTIANSTARTAIGDTSGLGSFVLADVGGGGEDADIVAAAGAVCRLGVVTWP